MMGSGNASDRPSVIGAVTVGVIQVWLNYSCGKRFDWQLGELLDGYDYVF